MLELAIEISFKIEIAEAYYGMGMLRNTHLFFFF